MYVFCLKAQDENKGIFCFLNRKYRWNISEGGMTCILSRKHTWVGKESIVSYMSSNRETEHAWSLLYPHSLEKLLLHCTYVKMMHPLFLSLRSRTLFIRFVVNIGEIYKGNKTLSCCGRETFGWKYKLRKRI